VQFAHRSIHGPTGHHRPGKSPVVPLHPVTQLPTPTIPLPSGRTDRSRPYFGADRSLHPIINQSPIFFFRSDQFTAGYHLREDQRTATTAQVPVPGGAGLATRFGHDTVGNLLAGAALGGAITRSGYELDGIRNSVTAGTHVTAMTVNDVNQPLPMVLQQPNRLPDAGMITYVWGVRQAYEDGKGIATGNVAVCHTDGLGSVRAPTDGSGALVRTFLTDAFGAPIASSGTITQAFQFTGEQRDPTGLINLRVRFYDPAIGRFMSRDPFAGVMGVPLSLNRYSYVLNNPVNAVDPSGLATAKILKNLKNSAEQLDCVEHPSMPHCRGVQVALITGGSVYVPGLRDPTTQSLAASSMSEHTAHAAENRESASAAASRAAFKAADNVGAFKLLRKHLPGARGRWNKFAADVDPVAVIEEALRSADATFTPNGVSGLFRVITGLARTVGSKGETAIRVIVVNDGAIWTAFPVRR